MRRAKPKPLYEPTPEDAAKLVAKHLGAYGKTGGWIYDKNDRPMYHGWSAYAERLRHSGIIKSHEVTDPATGDMVIRYAINWRRLKRPQ
jgi:hypothetical protein